MKKLVLRSIIPLVDSYLLANGVFYRIAPDKYAKVFLRGYFDSLILNYPSISAFRGRTCGSAMQRKSAWHRNLLSIVRTRFGGRTARAT